MWETAREWMGFAILFLTFGGGIVGAIVREIRSQFKAVGEGIAATNKAISGLSERIVKLEGMHQETAQDLLHLRGDVRADMQEIKTEMRGRFDDHEKRLRTLEERGRHTQ